MISRKNEAFFLFVGDVILLYLALFCMLFLRYGSGLDSRLVSLHLVPFSLLIILSIAVFFIAGLYERHTLLFQRHLPALLVKTLVVNSVLAIALFYFVPSLLITPRANLFIYLFVSFGLLFLWRRYERVVVGTGEKEYGILVGSGAEFRELEREVNGNTRYRLEFVLVADAHAEVRTVLEEKISVAARERGVGLLVADLHDPTIEPALPLLYSLPFAGVRVVSLHAFYEEVFGRIPSSLLGYRWFLEEVSTSGSRMYDITKRLMDIICVLPLLAVPLLAAPFLALAMRLEDGGPLFVRQTRVGKNGRPVEILKFRTMRFDDHGKWRPGGQSNGNQVTRVGTLLRRTRLDEFPALWNVLVGDLSLIGPRPEFKEAVEAYEAQMPFYNARHLLKPGLSGWAQLYGEHPHHGTDVAKTRDKLSYDLFYLKNRSFWLDIKIALKTLKVLLSRSGV